MEKKFVKKEYMVAYVKSHQRKYSLDLMKSTDGELIAKLDQEKSVNGLLRSVLKEHYGI